MAYGNKAAAASRIYSFGAGPPATEEERIRSQHRTAHRYRNDLVARERARREAVDAAVLAAFPDLAAVEAEIAETVERQDTLREEVKRRNAAARRRTATPEDRQAVAAITAWLKQLREVRKTLRAAAFGSEEVLRARKALSAVKKAVEAERDPDAPPKKRRKKGMPDPASPPAVARAERAVAAAEERWFVEVPEARGLTARLREIDAEDEVARTRLYNHYGDEQALLAAAEAERQRRGVRPGAREPLPPAALHWGTRLAISAITKQLRKGPPPRFRPWRGDARVAVQLQKGLPIEKAFAGTNGQFRIDPLPPVPDGRERRPAECRTTAYLRVGSVGRTPIWAAVPVSIHREIPPGTKIQWVYYAVRRIGTREEWRLQLVLSNRDPGAFARKDKATDGAVAIDVGWRVVPEGLRVAYWVGDDGREGQLVLPLDRVGSWEHVAALRSRRDVLFDGARATFADWLAGAPVPPPWLAEQIAWLRGEVARARRLKPRELPARERELEACVGLLARWGEPREVPEWLHARTETLVRWRSAARLAAVSIDWRTQRFAGDEAVFAWLDEWRKRDKHLYDWASSRQVKDARWRDDLFRQFVVETARDYRVALIEDTNWREMMRNPEPEATDREAELDRANKPYQRIAAVGRLLEVVREALPETVRVKAANTTRRCPDCGHVGVVDQAVLIVVCPNCQRSEDQDRRACRNLLGRSASGAVSAGGR